MATTTENYGFKKPASTDFYNIADQNDNWDACDEQLKRLNDGKAAASHNHDGTYATLQDIENLTASDVGAADADHNHNGTYATVNHNHSGVYSPVSHTHNYAGSSTAGGEATSASKATNDGSGRNIVNTYATKVSPEFSGSPRLGADTEYTSAKFRNINVVSKSASPVAGAASPYVNGTITFVKKA